MELLGHSEFFPVASPTLLSDRGRALSPSEISEFTLLHEYSTETWSRWFTSNGADFPPDLRSVTFDGAHLSLQAARAGYGIAMGDTVTVKSDLDSGTLMRLSPIAVPAAHPYYMIVSPQKTSHPVAAALQAWLVDCFNRATVLSPAHEGSGNAYP